jgi:hypothetical protein
MSKCRFYLAMAALADALGTPAAHAEDVMTQQQAVGYFASLEALGERCVTEVPSLQPAIAKMWTEGFDAPTGQWVAEMRKGSEYATALAKARTEGDAEWKKTSGRKRLLSCQALFGEGETRSQAGRELREMDETGPRTRPVAAPAR